MKNKRLSDDHQIARDRAKEFCFCIAAGVLFTLYEIYFA